LDTKRYTYLEEGEIDGGGVIPFCTIFCYYCT